MPDPIDRLCEAINRVIERKSISFEQAAREFYRRYGHWPDVSDIDLEQEREVDGD